MTARRRNRIRRLTQLAADQRQAYAGAKERLFATLARREERLSEAEQASLAARRAAFAALPQEARQRHIAGLDALVRERYG